MIETPLKSARPIWISLCTAAALPCFSPSGQTTRLLATADIRGCTNAGITGWATLREEMTDEGVKEVSIRLRVEGLSDGKRAVRVHQTTACEPCNAAKGHHDPGPFGQTRPDSTDRSCMNSIGNCLGSAKAWRGGG